MTTLAPLLLSVALAQDTWPAGATLDEAACVQVTDEGLNSLGAVVPGLVPGEIPIDETGDYLEEWGCYWYGYNLSGAWVKLTFKSVDITPDYGQLGMLAVFDVQINDPWDTFELWTSLLCIEDTCDGYVNPFQVDVTTTIAMEVVEDADGIRTLDATVGEMVADYTLTESDINLENCGIGGIEDVLNFFGLSLYTLILDAMAPELEKQLDDMRPDLETAIEDAFNELVINEQLDLSDVLIDLKLQPHDLTITPDGVDLQMEGSMAAVEVAECIAAWDPGTSPRTDSPIPGIDRLPAGTDFGLLASDDFANQAMYGLWQGGLLCYELTSADQELINTSLLGLLAGDAFEGITEDGAPLVIATRPREAPLAVMDGEHDIDIEVEDLGLDLYAEVDDRMARVLGLGLSTNVGIDLGFDSTTGELAIELDLAPEEMEAVITANEISSATDEELQATLSGAFESVLETFIGPMLGGNLAFALPSVDGLGLTSFEVEATGQQQDWLAVLAELGVVTYGADSEGCGSSEGCSSGCAASEAPGRVLWLLGLPLALVGIRRRS